MNQKVLNVRRTNSRTTDERSESEEVGVGGIGRGFSANRVFRLGAAREMA